MALDRNIGRQNPPFAATANPNTFITLVEDHGVLCRIVSARKCPCSGKKGSPDLYCDLCHGDGFIISFQRRLLQIDEEAPAALDNNARTEVYPYLIPLIEPVSVERLLAPEQGGIKKYRITGWTEDRVYIASDREDEADLPRHYERMRLTYYFDRFELVENDPVTLTPGGDIVTTETVVTDDQYNTGNAYRASGDIVEVLEIYGVLPDESRIDLTADSFGQNWIRVQSPHPDLSTMAVYASYRYAPPARVMVGRPDGSFPQDRSWTDIPEGTVQLGFQAWWDISPGDLVTLLVPEYTRDEVIPKSTGNIDTLREFDVSRITEDIVSLGGRVYRNGQDFRLFARRKIEWIGSTPPPGDYLTVRYSYHPTYVLYKNATVPDTTDNIRFPKTVIAHLFSMPPRTQAAPNTEAIRKTIPSSTGGML